MSQSNTSISTDYKIQLAYRVGVLIGLLIKDCDRRDRIYRNASAARSTVARARQIVIIIAVDFHRAPARMRKRTKQAVTSGEIIDDEYEDITHGQTT